MDLLLALESSLSIQSPSDPGLSRDRHKSVGYGTGVLGSDTQLHRLLAVRASVSLTWK